MYRLLKQLQKGGEYLAAWHHRERHCYTIGEERTNEKWVKRKECGMARIRKQFFILGCVLLFIEYL